MFKKMLRKIKDLPNWLNQTIASILFFLMILGGMIAGEYIDRDIQMVTFYVFLTFWVGGMASGLISLIRFLIKNITNTKD